MIAVLDASAAVKLVLRERHSELVHRLWDEPLRMIAPTIVLADVAAAIDGARRAGRLDPQAARRAQRSWSEVAEEIDLISVDLRLAWTAQRLAQARPARGMDAIYLATAIQLDERSVVGLISFDGRQRSVLTSADGIHLLPAVID